MRRVSIFQQRREGLEIKMTPMIDVVFLLLIFFVWTARFQSVEYVLPSRLTAQLGGQATDPFDVPPPEADFDDIVIQIRLAGTAVQWQVNQQAFTTLAEVQQVLRTLYDIKADVPVVLEPEDGVPFGEVINAYDIARVVGFQQVGFAVTAAKAAAAANAGGGP